MKLEIQGLKFNFLDPICDGQKVMDDLIDFELENKYPIFF
jgi:hypothetical protein